MLVSNGSCTKSLQHKAVHDAAGQLRGRASMSCRQMSCSKKRLTATSVCRHEPRYTSPKLPMPMRGPSSISVASISHSSAYAPGSGLRQQGKWQAQVWRIAVSKLSVPHAAGQCNGAQLVPLPVVHAPGLIWYL